MRRVRAPVHGARVVPAIICTTSIADHLLHSKAGSATLPCQIEVMLFCQFKP